MEDNRWYEVFIEKLYEKFPKKSQLTQELMSLLKIEREAVYRRLRREVIFPSHEIIKLASAWNISLDETIGTNYDNISFHLKLINFINPSDEEYEFMQQLVEGYRSLQNFPNAELMDITNKIPRPLISNYYNLTKFFYLRWTYQYGFDEEIVPFSKINLSDKVFKLITEFTRVSKLIPNTYYIWDNNLFDYLANNIQYFYSINLMSDEDKELIKKDLQDLLDYMQEVAHWGRYPETQNKVTLYLSQLNIDTNYTYGYSPETCFCLINVFGKNELYTYNAEMGANFKYWMQLKKKNSIQISEVDERSRIEFFTKQKQLINSL